MKIKLDKNSKDPLYRQVKEGLLAQMRAGAYTPDTPLPTENDLADSLSLSRLTVRRALVELAQEGLVRRFPGRGTFIVAGGARSVSTYAALVLGDEIPVDLSNPFVGRLLRGIQSASLPAPVSLRRLPDQQTDLRDTHGIVALWVLNPEALRALTEYGIPVVAYECPPDAGGRTYDVITHANENGAFDAVSALINLGHRDIACAYHPELSGRERQAGYERALLQHGLTPTPERNHVCINGAAASYAFGRRLLTGPAKAPTALFCSDDTIAYGVLAAAQEMGLRIPQHMSLVGFGDLGPFCTPALSTVRMDIPASGREAIRLLQDRAANPALPARQVVLPTEFINRASCGPPRMG